MHSGTQILGLFRIY